MQQRQAQHIEVTSAKHANCSASTEMEQRCIVQHKQPVACTCQILSDNVSIEVLTGATFRAWRHDWRANLGAARSSSKAWKANRLWAVRGDGLSGPYCLGSCLPIGDLWICGNMLFSQILTVQVSRIEASLPLL